MKVSPGNMIEFTTEEMKTIKTVVTDVLDDQLVLKRTDRIGVDILPKKCIFHAGTVLERSKWREVP